MLFDSYNILLKYKVSMNVIDMCWTVVLLEEWLLPMAYASSI